MKFKKRWIILVILLGLLKSLYVSASIIPRTENEVPGQRMLNEAAYQSTPEDGFVSVFSAAEKGRKSMDRKSYCDVSGDAAEKLPPG